MTSSNHAAEPAESILEEQGNPARTPRRCSIRCSIARLKEAGFHKAFSIRHIDQMPEHESEFVPGACGQLSGIRDYLAALYRVPPKALLELVELFYLDLAGSPHEPLTPLP